jgi:hypothetical protein
VFAESLFVVMIPPPSRRHGVCHWQGIAPSASSLLAEPHVGTQAKDRGMLVFTWGAANNSHANVEAQQHMGVHAVCGGLAMAEPVLWARNASRTTLCGPAGLLDDIGPTLDSEVSSTRPTACTPPAPYQHLKQIIADNIGDHTKGRPSLFSDKR